MTRACSFCGKAEEQGVILVEGPAVDICEECVINCSEIILEKKNHGTKYDFRNGDGHVPAHKHKNGGGWVQDTAYVAETAYVGPDATVYEKARVYSRARIYDNAQVHGDAKIYDDAWINDFAEVGDHVEVYGEARISGRSTVRGSVTITGCSRILDGEIY